MDRRWVVVGVIGLVSIGAGWWFGRDVTAAPSTPVVPSVSVSPAPAAMEDAGVVTVHVAGWVATPGLVVLPEGARVSDALKAAGGVAPGAVVDGINLAEVLVDAQQVLVPGPGDDGAMEAAADAATTDGRIRINSADAAELEALPGIGPVLAERIVAYRQEMGPFERVEDLLEVSGIGEAKLAALRDAILVP